MELFLIIMLFVVFIGIPVAVTANNVIEPYMNGTKHIDKLKHPTLYRAHRIIRSSNAKKRELEHRIKVQHFDNKRLEVERAIDKAIIDNRVEKADEHHKEVQEWEGHFRAITAEEDARKLREEQERVAEELRKKKALEAELRERELAVWTANEKARLARFKAEQEALQRQEDERVARLLEQREKDIHTLSKHHVGGQYNPDNQHMCVTVHGLYVRKLPTKDSRIIDNLVHHSWVTVNGWIAHEQVYGNPIWFRLANGQGWIWSGGVHTQATTGIENLNHLKEPGDTYEIRGGAGDVFRTSTEPSQLERMIDREIEDLKREKQALEDQQNGVTRIHAELVTADYIYPPMKKKVTRTEPSKSFTPEEVARIINYTL